MTFASEIIKDGLALVLVDEEDIGLDAADFSLGTRFLNDYCAELFDLGVDFGYRPITVSGDPITSPASVNLALKYNLGVLLAPAFGLPSQSAVLKAAELEKRLKANFLRRTRSRLPSTLPMGSGNRSTRAFNTGFYPFPLPVANLRLASSSTVTIATVNVAVIVAGWTVDRSINLTSLAAGTVQYLGDSRYLAMLEASFTVTSAASDQFTFYFRKNSAEIEQSRIVFDADVDQNILMKWTEVLMRGDTVDVAVENNTDASDIVLPNGHFTVS